MSITDIFELTLIDIKKWNTKYNNSIKIGVIRSNQQNIMNTVTMSFGKRQFNILCSSIKGEPFIVDYVGTDRLQWIDDFNLFVINKLPSITKLLTVLSKQVEKMKDDIKEVKLTKLLDHIDMSTNLGFDLEKYKKKKELETFLSTSVSNVIAITGIGNFKQIAQLTSKDSMFGREVVGQMIIEEFLELWELGKTGKKKFMLDTVNNNIFNWRVKFYDFSKQELMNSLSNLEKKFGYNSIEVDICIHDTLYPNYPPTVKIIRPRLMNSLMHRISNTKMIQLDYWNPTRSMMFIIHKLQTLLDKNAEVCDVELNDINKYPDGSFHKIETLLLDLASNVETTEVHDIDEEVYENMLKEKRKDSIEIKSTKSNFINNNGDKTNTIWTSGTGYGHGGTGTWNVESYLKSQKARDNIIQSILTNIINEIQDTKFDINIVFNAIKHSVLMNYLKSQLNETTLLEINKHKPLFTLIFNLIGNLVNEKTIDMFNEVSGSVKSMFTIFTELNYMCKTSIKYDKSEDEIIDTIMTIYDMLKPCYQIYIDTYKQQGLTHTEKKENLSDEQEYVQHMIQLRDTDDEHKLIGTNYYYQQQFDNDKSKRVPSDVIKRLRNEFVAFSSLPISYNAIIISRPDKDYMTTVRTLMTGPDKTPYECGIFLFDTFINTHFPKEPPNVWFLNTGGKRFNPNLYESGKVCLSILGTWRGDNGSESWNDANSTLIQIYISIQAQILTEQPFYNEPGHESSYNNNTGRQRSMEYNNNIRLFTMKHAMLDLIQNLNIYPQFSDVIRTHFTMKKKKVIEVCNEWVTEAPESMKADYVATFNAINTELGNL